MPKPFPFPLTVGTDICHVKRIYEILTTGISAIPSRGGISRYGAKQFRERKLAKRGKRFIYRVLNQQEISESLQVGRLDLSAMETGAFSTENLGRISDMARFLGGRWAAKEAVMKAYPSLKLTFHDITIQASISGGDQGTKAPTAVLSIPKDGFNTAAEDAQEVPISISHDGEYATAVALGFNGVIDGRHLQEVGDSTEIPGPLPTYTDDDEHLQGPRGLNNAPLSHYSTNPQTSDLIDHRPFQHPPMVNRKKPAIPELGMFTVEVSNLHTSTTKKFLLQVFKLRYSSVRWVTIDPQQHIKDDLKYVVGSVTFNQSAEAQRAIQEMDGYELIGKNLKVSRVVKDITALNEENRSNRLFNEDFNLQYKDGDMEPEKRVNLTPRITIHRLGALQQVFQDNPVIVSEGMKHKFGGSLWDTDEIIRSAKWDSIQGEPVHPIELEDLIRYEEREREWREERRNRALREENTSGDRRENSPRNIREFVKDAIRMRTEEDWDNLRPLIKEYKNNRVRRVRNRPGLSILP